MNTHVLNFNNKLINLLQSNSFISLDLAYGKMGFCIYFYYLSRQESNTSYKTIAEKLLDEIFSNITHVRNIDITDGLAGIALGINFLIKNKYVSGDVNNVLLDVDDEIFKKLTDNQGCEHLSLTTILQSLFYFSVRLIDQKVGSENEFLHQNIVIQLVNQLANNLSNNSCDEKHLYYNCSNYELPQILFVLSCVYKLNFYNYRVEKIIEEVLYKACTRIPMLNSNKLYLLWGLDKMNKCYKNDRCEKHISLLEKVISVEAIFNEELRDKKLFLNDGYSSIYWLLFSLREYFDKNEFILFLNRIREKINNPDMWEELDKGKTNLVGVKTGIFNGLFGIILTLYELDKELTKN